MAWPWQTRPKTIEEYDREGRALVRGFFVDLVIGIVGTILEHWHL
jgi:hypothetical protein